MADFDLKQLQLHDIIFQTRTKVVLIHLVLYNKMIKAREPSKSYMLRKCLKMSATLFSFLLPSLLMTPLFFKTSFPSGFVLFLLLHSLFFLDLKSWNSIVQARERDFDG